jgi:hypothetical protein
MSPPSPAMSYAEEEGQYYHALGKALTQWQQVEKSLAAIFSGAVNPTSQLSANAAFHTVLSFDSKLGMTHSAIAFAFRGTRAIEAWSPLHNKAGRRNNRRNQLAHFTVDFDPRRRPGYRLHLRPSLFDMRAYLKWGNAPPTLNVCQIVASGNSFEKLANDLLTFHLQWTVPPFVARALASLPQEASPHPQPHISGDQNATEPEVPPGS